MTVGRNDPCPCGSGKKFKICHGAELPIPFADHSLAARVRALKAADVEFGVRLMRYAEKTYGENWLAGAFEDYLNVEGAELSPIDAQLAVPWALHVLPATLLDETPADEFLTEQPDEFTPDMRVLHDAYRASWLSIWEVRSVERNVGAKLVDMLSREERFVYDSRSSQTLERFDALLAIVLDVEGVSFFGGAHGQPLPPQFAAQALHDAQKLYHVRTRAVPPARLRDVDDHIGLVAIWNEQASLLRNQPPPALHNTDGDPFKTTTDDFALLAGLDEVAGRLTSMTGVQSSGERGIFLLVRPGITPNRDWDSVVVARITLTESRLRVETNSTRRADALRGEVETHLAGMIRFRLRSEANTEDLLRRARASAESRRRAPEPDPPPEALAEMRAFRERHIEAWLDDSIPALRGLTPREAARSARDRAALEVLMKELERGEQRLPAAQRLDVSRLRDELGLSELSS